MVLLTMISRVQDGLLLAASMQETEQSNRNFQEYHNQAKQLFRKLGDHSPNRCSLEAGTMTFHYLISQGVCYLTLCEANYSKKLAFSFLEELQAEFWELYGKKVSSVSRPYAFIEFDIYIQKLKKSYLDTWSKRHLSSINMELQDVQKIMVTNIEEVLQRGETLSALDSKASNLSTLSKKYRHDAKLLNSRSAYAKAAVTGLIFMLENRPLCWTSTSRILSSLNSPVIQYFPAKRPTLKTALGRQPTKSSSQVNGRIVVFSILLARWAEILLPGPPARILRVEIPIHLEYILGMMQQGGMSCPLHASDFVR